MKEYIRIIRQTGINYLSLIFINIIGIVLIFLLTRNLTIAEYGVYSLLAVLIMVFPFVLNLGLDQFIITKLSGIPLPQKKRYFFSLFLFEIMFLLIIISIFFLPTLQRFILASIKLQEYAFEFKITLLIIFFITLIKLLASYYISNKKLEFTISMNTSKETLWIIFLIVFFVVFKKIQLPTVMSLWFLGIILTFLVSLLSFRKYFKNLKFQFLRSPIKRGLIFGIPLIPFLFGTYIISLGDRYIINYFSGTTQVGIYALAYVLTGAIYTFGAIIANIMRPYISEAWNTKKDHNTLLNISLKYTFLIVIPSLVGFFILKEAIITLISGVKYLPSIPVINILIFYPIFAVLIIVFYQYLLLKNKTITTGLIYLGGAALNIFLNIILIPIYGLSGAAMATVITYFLIFLTIFTLCKKDITINFKYLKVIRIILAATIMGISIIFINPQIFITKILTIVLGIGVYFTVLLLFKVFRKGELRILTLTFFQVIKIIKHKLSILHYPENKLCHGKYKK